MKRSPQIAIVILAMSAGSAHAAAVVDEHAKELERVKTIVARDKGCRELKPNEVKSILGPRTPKTFESASACIHARGRAVSIGVTTYCGSDSCSVSGWLFTDARPLASIPHETAFEITDDLQSLFYTRNTMTKNLTYEVDVARRDLTTNVDASFAKCASPSISPGGGWVLCRTPKNDVLKAPIGGGATTLVLEGNGVVTAWTPYAYIYPRPVSFPSATSMEVWIGDQKRVVPWKE